MLSLGNWILPFQANIVSSSLKIECPKMRTRLCLKISNSISLCCSIISKNNGISSYTTAKILINDWCQLEMLQIHSKDSLTHLGQSPYSPGLAQSSVAHTDGSTSEDREGERTRIVTMYEKRLEEMQRNHVDECQEMKERHNDKVESLLQRLCDVNNRFVNTINLFQQSIWYTMWKHYFLFIKGWFLE